MITNVNEEDGRSVVRVSRVFKPEKSSMKRWGMTPFTSRWEEMLFTDCPLNISYEPSFELGTYFTCMSKAHLSEQQLETLGAYRCSLMEKRQAELQDRYRRALESAEDSEGSCPRRDVTPVWRLCVADSMAQHGSGEFIMWCTRAVFSIVFKIRV